MHHSLRLLDAGQVACGRRGLTGWEAAHTLRGEKEFEKYLRFCGISFTLDSAQEQHK